MLPGVGPEAAVTIAQRIRGRTESTIVSLAPGITDRITVSIGVAAAPIQALERISLLRLADEALYQAKEDGRNRVAYLGESAPGLELAAEPADASAASHEYDPSQPRPHPGCVRAAQPVQLAPPEHPRSHRRPAASAGDEAACETCALWLRNRA